MNKMYVIVCGNFKAIVLAENEEEAIEKVETNYGDLEYVYDSPIRVIELQTEIFVY